MLIDKSVEIALDKGVIKSKNLLVDSLHSASRYHNKSPHEVLQEQARALRKAVYKTNVGMKEKFPAKINSSDLNDHINYCKDLLEVVEREETLMVYEDVRQSANYLNEIVDDNLEKIKTSVDEDARTGHKSADTSFFGYKTHLGMTEERIITAAVVTSGEKADGKYLPELVEKSRNAGITVETVIGDGAYSERANIEYAKDNFELISRLHPGVTQGLRKDEDKFEFNKDAGMYVCKAGHMAKSKTRRHNKQTERNENPRMVYYFDIDKCKRCPMREGCYKGAKSKSYSVSLGSKTHSEHEAFQETEYFKEQAAHRYKIEAKNGELKNCHGYSTAESSGITAMEIQGATAIFVVNLKRIVKLMGQR